MRVGCVVGRFQIADLHAGHKALLNHVYTANDLMIVFVGVSRAPGTKRNPLDFISRQQMLEEYLQQLSYTPSTKVLIYPVLDQHDDELWSKLLDDQIHSIGIRNAEITIYGGRDSFLPRYYGKHKTKELKDLGWDVENATAHRESIRLPLPSAAFRSGVIHATQTSFRSVFSTVDAALIIPMSKWVLLGKKPNEKQWRFPGGFVDAEDVSLEAAVSREASEETGIVIHPALWKYISSRRGDDWRYPGPERIHTTFYAAEVSDDLSSVQAGDDLASVGWHPIDHTLIEKVVRTHKNLAEALIVWFNKNYKIVDLTASRR